MACILQISLLGACVSYFHSIYHCIEMRHMRSGVWVLVLGGVHCAALLSGITLVSLAKDLDPHRHFHDFSAVCRDVVVPSDARYLSASWRAGDSQRLCPCVCWCVGVLVFWCFGVLEWWSDGLVV